MLRAFAALLSTSLALGESSTVSLSHVMKLDRSNFGGVAFPACRWKHDLTIADHCDDPTQRLVSLSTWKRYGQSSDVKSKARCPSHASSGWDSIDDNVVKDGP